MNHTLICELKNKLFTKTNKLNSSILRRDWFLKSDLCVQIFKTTPFLSCNHSLSERIYCIINDINDIKKCPICKKPLTFKTFQDGYLKSCNNHNCLRKIYTWHSSSQTMLNNMTNTKKLFLEEYNNKKFSIINKEDVINYIQKRNIETNYGVLHQFVNIKILKNDKNILYNILILTENIIPIDINDFKWSERFYIILHNIQNIPNCIYCNNKTTYINIKQGYQPYCKKKCLYDYQIKRISEQVITQGFTIKQQINKINDGKIIIECNKCGKILSKDLSDGKSTNIYCSGCNHDFGVSKEEKDVLSFIKSIYNKEILENYRLNNKELDIFIKDANLAIEYNGIYWHSYDDIYIEQTKKYNHLNKTKLCFSNKIQLLHIFSHEWKNKNNIWKSIIRNKLNLTDKIFARKCVIQEVSNNDKNEFLNDNHLQGQDISSIRLGLYYNNMLVSIMTFSKTRYNKNYEWEMVRFCTKLNYCVIGAASRLLNHFEKNYKPKSLITYADKRYSNGGLYLKMGFTMLHETQPNYFYWSNKTGVFISRIAAQKHKLKSLLKDEFNDKLSEAQNMFNNNYRRIWDCGNLVFIKKYDQFTENN